MHVVPNGFPLNTPIETSATITIEIINNAQPYVIRYSIALCSLNVAM